MTDNTALANIENLSDFQLYSTPEWWIQVKVFVENEGLWLSQKQMTELFWRDRSVITRHINKIFEEWELEEKSNVQKMHISGSDKPVTFYNIDVTIAVWYRVKSFQATHFRKWATKTLRDHVMQWYTVNEQRLGQIGTDELEKKLALFKRAVEQKALTDDETKGLLDLIVNYLPGILTIWNFDNKSLPDLGETNEEQYKINRLEAVVALANLKARLVTAWEATELFAHPKDDGGLDACFGTIYQTSQKIDLYPTVEEKAAMLLYLIIKNHPFTDGNKRSGAFLFIRYLDKNNILLDHNGKEKISQQTLVALALLIATSAAGEKDMMVRLVVALLQ